MKKPDNTAALVEWLRKLARERLPRSRSCNWERDFSKLSLMPEQQAAAALEAQARTIAEHEHSFDLCWNANMRAIKRWQEATGRTLVLPDHTDLCVWLLEQNDAQARTIAERDARIECLSEMCIAAQDAVAQPGQERNTEREARETEAAARRDALATIAELMRERDALQAQLTAAQARIAALEAKMRSLADASHAMGEAFSTSMADDEIAAARAILPPEQGERS